MYVSNGELDVEYLLEEDLTEEQFVEAEEKLIDKAYRDVTEWRMAVRSEQGIDEVNSLAEEAAKTAYLIDRIQGMYTERNRVGDLSDEERKAVEEGNTAWKFVNESGTSMQYIGKDPGEMEEGDFCLVNGENTSFDSTEWDSDTVYRPPEFYVSEMSGPFPLRYVEVNDDADLEDLPGEGERIEF